MRAVREVAEGQATPYVARSRGRPSLSKMQGPEAGAAGSRAAATGFVAAALAEAGSCGVRSLRPERYTALADNRLTTISVRTP